MKISVFGKAISIRALESALDSDKLTIAFSGVNDGTEVMLKKDNGRYAVSTVKDSCAVFPMDLLSSGGRYTVSLKNNDGYVLSVSFLVSNGAMQRSYSSVDAELTAMWEALMTMADLVSEAKHDIDTLIRGYVTE